MGAQVFKLVHYPLREDLSPNAPASGSDAKLVTLSRTGHAITITNSAAPGGANLLISFNGGQTYYPVLPQGSLQLDALFQSFHLSSSGAAVSWAALVAEG